MNKLLQFFIDRLCKNVWLASVTLSDGNPRKYDVVFTLINAANETDAKQRARDKFFKLKEFNDVKFISVTACNLNDLIGEGKLFEFIRK